MLRRIMMNEWRILSREWILHLAIPVYCVMLILGVLNGTGWRSFLESTVAEAQQTVDAQFAALHHQVDLIQTGRKKAPEYLEDPRMPAATARTNGYEFATKPPGAATAIAIGQSDLLTSYRKVQWKPMFRQSNAGEIENPANLANGHFDLSFVLIYLYPLLIIALSFNVLSSERESGTQVLLLSQPVTVSTFVLGKVALRGAIVVGLAVLISTVGVLLANPDILALGGAWRVLALDILLIIYGTFWFGLSVLINAFGWKSATNALAMMSLWIALVLVAPTVSNLIATELYPLPSRVNLVEALRRADLAAQRDSDVDQGKRSNLLRMGQETSLFAIAQNFYAQVMQVEQQAEAKAAPVFRLFDAQKNRQQGLAEQLKYLSPAAIMQVALTELADTSVQSFANFDAQVDQYHTAWRRYFMAAVLANKPMTSQDVARIPRFRYEPEADAAIVQRVLANGLALAAIALIVVAAGFWRLRQYSPGSR
jgi:ABC-2 type transport system permease protein